ncbi:flagellar biosynthesis protein FlgH [Opitutaceae bacterium EW11]|nr:flagellar biosynthesis protein FlgH [Opitutaceae bacterium EW11]
MKALPLLCTLCLAAPLVRADSLWTTPTNNERSMYSDKKASRTGDILTVVVSETAATQSSQSKKSNNDSSIDAGISQFLFPPSVSGFGTKGGALPATKLAAKSDFSGGGSVNNTQSLTARAAVLVTDVLPNGNLVIEGVRVVIFSGETQFVVLHGLVRPDDITSANTIASSNIADVRIEFISEGSLTDAQKKGWLTKLYDKLRPY